MPNYCENELHMKGELNEISKVFLFIKTKKTIFDFNKVIPYPKKFAEKDKLAEKEKRFGNDGYNSGGYEWCINHWGTKWNAIAPETINNKRIDFSTAWSPPIPIIHQLSKLFPEIEFTIKFWEGGIGFRGMYRCKRGDMIANCEYAYRGNRGG